MSWSIIMSPQGLVLVTCLVAEGLLGQKIFSGLCRTNRKMFSTLSFRGAMKSSFHILVSSIQMRREILILGQNMLLPAQHGLPPQFAAVVYAAHDLHTEAPAAALLIKTAFSRPMMPLISPGNPVWDDVVLPHLELMLETVGQQARQPRGPRLGGIAEQVSRLVKNHPSMLTGGGALLMPQIDLPLPVQAHAMRSVPALPRVLIPPFHPVRRAPQPFAWPKPAPLRRAA